MKKNSMAALAAAILLLTALGGCGKSKEPAETLVPAAEVQSDAPQDIPAESPALPDGTWQTASITMEADGNMVPEYHVRFVDDFIVYGHMKDGAFEEDHKDRIVSLSETAAGVRVQAESSKGVQYSYETCESDRDVLEYYETWDEAVFPEAYRGGASLFRSS